MQPCAGAYFLYLLLPGTQGNLDIVLAISNYYLYCRLLYTIYIVEHQLCGSAQTCVHI